MTAEIRKEGGRGVTRCGWRETEHVTGPDWDAGAPWADCVRSGGTRREEESVLRERRREGLVGESGFQRNVSGGTGRAG